MAFDHGISFGDLVAYAVHALESVPGRGRFDATGKRVSLTPTAEVRARLQAAFPFHPSVDLRDAEAEARQSIRVRHYIDKQAAKAEARHGQVYAEKASAYQTLTGPFRPAASAVVRRLVPGGTVGLNVLVYARDRFGNLVNLTVTINAGPSDTLDQLRQRVTQLALSKALWKRDSSNCVEEVTDAVLTGAVWGPHQRSTEQRGY